MSATIKMYDTPMQHLCDMLVVKLLSVHTLALSFLSWNLLSLTNGPAKYSTVGANQNIIQHYCQQCYYCPGHDIYKE